MTSRESEEAAVGAIRSPAGAAASALAPAIDVPESYDEVERLIIAGSPAIFVSGSAGTGKTTLIRHLGNVLPHRTVVVAPTGVAALNAGGVTIHSFFQFPPRIQDPSEIRLLSDRKLIRKLELLVVDEVSMLRCDVLDCIDAFLRANRDVEEPFGGVQILFVGDLYQLPPVVPRHEWEVLRSRGYASAYFFSAHVLRDVLLAHVELDRVYRQRDPAFVALLNTIRAAEDMGEVVGEINDSCYDAGDADHDITLTCTNQRADEINSTSMAALDSPEHLFEGEIEGEFRLDKQKLPSPIDLRLKAGARVMFTRNDEERRWVNGTTGIVREVDARSIRVELGGGRSSKVYDVLPVAWESYEYVFDEHEQQIVARKTGEYRQYPLMLAWAVTIHKSQGKTLDRVLVDFGSGAFAGGQAYVALSRVRSLEGIRLARPMRVADVRCDPMIRRFYQTLYEAVD